MDIGYLQDTETDSLSVQVMNAPGFPRAAGNDSIS